MKKKKQIVDIKKKQEIQIPDGRQMILLIEKKKEIAKNSRWINSIRVYNINTEHTKLIIKPESRSHRWGELYTSKYLTSVQYKHNPIIKTGILSRSRAQWHSTGKLSDI